MKSFALFVCLFLISCVYSHNALAVAAVGATFNITGSCFVGSITVTEGDDPTLTILNGKPVYYNAAANVNFGGSSITTDVYVYFALATELSTPEDRWVIALSGQPYYYIISSASTAPTGNYLPFDPNATVANCGGSVTLSPPCSPITPSFTQVSPICASASLAPLPTTSTNGVSGSWAPSINNMATTTYTFTPSSNPCASSVTMTITVNNVVTPTFTQVAPICSGASLNALPTSSTNGVNGTWAPAMNNMNTTTYTFTPIAGQCANSVTMTIQVNPSNTPNFTQVSAICEGDPLAALPTISLNGINGTWAPSINNMSTTTYTFTPSVPCADVTYMTIVVHPKPTVTTTHSACDTYSWHGTNYTSTGNYTYTSLTANGCVSTENLQLTINQSTSSSSTQTECDSYLWNGTTYTTSGMYTSTNLNAAGCVHTSTLNLTIINSTPTFLTASAVGQYTWSVNGTFVTYYASGTYTQTITSPNGCAAVATLYLTITPGRPRPAGR